RSTRLSARSPPSARASCYQHSRKLVITHCQLWGVVPSPPLKAGIPWCLAGGHPAKEGLIGALDAEQHVLQDLGRDLSKLRMRGFEVGQPRLLLGLGRTRALPVFPPGLTLL